MLLYFEIGSPYYYFFLAVSCFIGRALCLGYLRFFRGKRIRFYEDTISRSFVIISFVFFILICIDTIIDTEFDIHENTIINAMRLSGIFFSMWGDYILDKVVNFPTFTSSIYKYLCIKLNRNYNENENPLNATNPHKEYHKKLLIKITNLKLYIENMINLYKKNNTEYMLIIVCYNKITSDYVKTKFDYEYIPSSDVEKTLEKLMVDLEFTYHKLIELRDEIIADPNNPYTIENAEEYDTMIEYTTDNDDFIPSSASPPGDINIGHIEESENDNNEEESEDNNEEESDNSNNEEEPAEIPIPENIEERDESGNLF